VCCLKLLEMMRPARLEDVLSEIGEVCGSLSLQMDVYCVWKMRLV
jgi:hypothetical protein